MTNNYLPDADYFVYYDLFPWSVRGLVTVNEDGTYSIFLNRRYPNSVLQKTFRHEIDHIEHDDFFNGIPIEKVEDL